METPRQRRVKGTRDAAATREALIEAGTALFAERGFDGATVDAIARRAAVNKAMIHYHFGSKEGLYRAILVDVYAGLAARVREVCVPADPPAVRLRRFIEAFAETNLRRPGLSAMVLKEIVAGGAHIDANVFPHVTELLGTVRRALADGVAAGTFRPVDPVMTHSSMILGLAAYFATRPFRERLAAGPVPGAAPDPDVFVRHYTALVIGGLTRGPAAQES